LLKTQKFRFSEQILLTHITSAKTGSNVDFIFDKIAEKLI
jgi:hypothetical protein